jgi:hypothetical protein
MMTLGTAFSNMGLHRPILAKNTDGIPPNGTYRHELYPDYCSEYTQHRYIDNDDDVISICDYISPVDGAGNTYRPNIIDVL